MASYTLATAPNQESLLTWVVAQYNAEHNTTLSNSDYITLRFPQLLAPFASLYQSYLAGQITKNYSAADAATQQQVLSLLKVS